MEVSGYSPGATIDLFLGVSTSPFTSFTPTGPDSFTTDVATALTVATGTNRFTASQQLYARQRIGTGPSSGPSDAVTVVTRVGPLPTPTVLAPLYQCARTVAVGGVERGMSLTIANVPTTGPSTTLLGWTQAWSDLPTIPVAPHVPTSRYQAQTQLCSLTAGPAMPPQTVIPTASGPPEPLAPPALVNGTLIAGQRFLDIDGAVFGASLSVRINGVTTSYTVTSLPGDRFRVPLSGPLAAGNTVSVGQRLCGATPTFGPNVTTATCASLPPPQVRLPRVGDRFLDVEVRWPGATIRAYVGAEKVADGSGSRIGLFRPLAAGETLTVFQFVGSCTSAQGFRVTVQCTQRTPELDPSLGGPFSVGSAEYNSPTTISLGGRQVLVRGIVRYPVDRAGPSQRLARWQGRRPLVLVMHGNGEVMKATSSGITPFWIYGNEPRSIRQARVVAGTHQAVDGAQGYNDLLDSLARAGIIAVSIDAEDLGTPPGSMTTFFEEGAELFVQHLTYWNTLNSTGVGAGLTGATAGDFLGQVDLSRVGLAGHSRGGERVSRVRARVATSPLAGIVTIRSGFLMAPAAAEVPPSGMPYLILGGSRDLDTEDMPIRLYDQAGEPSQNVPDRFLEWVYHANHRDWNARWTTMGLPQFNGGSISWPYSLLAEDQVRMVRVWGRLFFEWSLLGVGESRARAVLNGDSSVRGINDQNVFSSHSSTSDLRIDSFRASEPTVGTFDLGGTATFSGFGFLLQRDDRTRVERHDQGAVATFSGSLFGQIAATGPAEIAYDFASPVDATSWQNLSFRIAKVQCNNRDYTGMMVGDLCYENAEMDGLGVTVEVRSGGTVRSVVVTNPSGTAVLPGRRVPPPWAFFDITAFSNGSSSVPNTVRVPQACFGSVPPGFWSSLSSVRIRIANASEHMVLSDISLAR